MQKKRKVLLKIFVSTLYLSAFTFGGGYVIVTLMKKKFVDEYHWIEEDEMLDLIAIAQSWSNRGQRGNRGGIQAGGDDRCPDGDHCDDYSAVSNHFTDLCFLQCFPQQLYRK